MAQFDWTILQNGCDIRGVAMNGIIGEEVTLSRERVGIIGDAFVRWLWKRCGEKSLRIAIGMDCRITSPDFMEELEYQITKLGCDVLNCGLASTPAMFLSTNNKRIGADGAIMITGSHQTFNRNGLKFFIPNADVSRADISEILLIASINDKTQPSKEKGQTHITNLIASYAAVLREKICADINDRDDYNHPLRGFRIIVDAGNGAGGFYARRVLKPLGADVSDSQFLEPDGRFPNHVPNPEDYESMHSISTAVRYHSADLGLLFDTDVDRVAVVDSNGREIFRNELVALASAIVLSEHPDTTIVTDSITSEGLGYFITRKLNGRHRRFLRGYRNVINEAIRLNANDEECWLAVETSGHSAFRENHFLDDGAYLATKIVIKMAQLRREGRHLSDLISELPIAKESREYRIHITMSDFSRVASEVMAALRLYVAQMPNWEEVNQNYEGLRVMCNSDTEKGWFMLRLSLHEPELPLNVESDIEGGLDNIMKRLKQFFRNISGIEYSDLQ